MKYPDRPEGSVSGAAAVRQAIQPEHAVPPSDQTSLAARAERVAELQKQFQQGALEADASKVAAAIVANHLRK